MAYIEQKFYDDGKAEARLIKEEVPVRSTNTYDHYVDFIGSDCERDIAFWITNNLEVDEFELEDLVNELSARDWVDISKYC